MICGISVRFERRQRRVLQLASLATDWLAVDRSLDQNMGRVVYRGVGRLAHMEPKPDAERQRLKMAVAESIFRIPNLPACRC